MKIATTIIFAQWWSRKQGFILAKTKNNWGQLHFNEIEGIENTLVLVVFNWLCRLVFACIMPQSPIFAAWICCSLLGVRDDVGSTRLYDCGRSYWWKDISVEGSCCSIVRAGKGRGFRWSAGMKKLFINRFFIWRFYIRVTSLTSGPVHTTPAWEIWKRKNYRMFWICVWGELVRRNHIHLVKSSFSKSYF